MALPSLLCAQTYINKEWAQSTGQPDDITWQASTIDPFGDLIVVGNTQLGPGNSDVLVTKYNRMGELLWQQTFDGTAGANDYGVAVVTNSAGDVFVAATVHQTGNDLDFALLKYSSTGSLVWGTTWNGPSDRADVPAGLFLDDLGNIYMHGASWAGPIFADHAFVKFSGAGAVVWHSIYDHAGLHDAAIGAEVVDGTLVSFGASATAMGEWAITVLKHDPATGAILNTYLSPLPGVGLHETSAWTMDQGGNFYVTGTYHDGSQNVIQTMKIGTGFGIQWLENYDGNGLGAIGATVAADEAGNVYVGGAMYNAQGGLEFITLKYDPYGNLLWRREYKPHSGQHTALVTKLAVHESGIIVAGTAFDGSSLSFATLMYNENGKLLWSEEHGSEQTSDKAMALALGQQGVIYVSGITGDITDEWTYTTVKYDVYHKDNPAVLDSLGNPQYMANEVIVKFRPHPVDTAVVDSKDWQHGVLSDIVPDSIQLAIENKLGVAPGYLSRMKVVKVFRQLTRADSISISRLGEEVRMPKLWSTFIITDPSIGENVNMIADSLSTMWEYVSYAHSNMLFQLYSNDPLFDQDWQSSLKPTTEFPFADINIEPAWAIQTGQPFIRVGVVDTPVRWDHEDFVHDGQTKITSGYDYTQLFEIDPSNNTYSNLHGSGGWHGTGCASIIGALRNNEKGVAGIAGGDVLGTGNTGTTIVPLVIGNFFNYISTESAASAILEGSSDITSGYGYACHALNLSWGDEYPGFGQDYAYALAESILSANRNHCNIVAAQGNFGGSQSNYRSIPASFASHPDAQDGLIGDNAVISVGASGDNGEHLYLESQNTNGLDINSVYGYGVDIVAPGSSSNIYIVHELSHDLISCAELDPETFGYTINTRYTCFQGTSAAAPHVTGVVALMLAEHSTINGAPNGLAPEDVEHILERSATDIFNLDIDTLPYSGYLVGYDDYHGHGRLNAGAALTLASDPYCVIHSGAPNSTSLQQYASETITIPARNLLELPGGVYTAYRVQVTHNYTDVYPVNAEIIEPNGSWGRESSTIGTHDQASTINGRTWADYDFSVSGNSASVTATTNAWFIQNSTDNSVVVNAWYPAPPEQLRTAYSHLVMNADCWGPSSVSIQEEFEHQGIVLYPNPAQDVLTIECSGLYGTGWELSVIDPMGRIILTQDLSVSAATQIPVAQLPSGTYCVLVRRGQDVHVRRFIKLH